MPEGYQTITNGAILDLPSGHYVVWLMDARDRDAVAAQMPSDDRWTDDLRDAADELRRREAADHA